MIFFDMGGTIDLYPVCDECVKLACAKMQTVLADNGERNLSAMNGSDFRKIILDGIRKYTSWRKVDCIELSPERLFSDFIFSEHGVDGKIINSCAEELAFLIDTEFYKRRAREEAAEALEAIRQKGVRMGIISNVMSRGQVKYCLDKYGLADYFEIIVLSSVFGKRKPHPDIFVHACNESGVKPEEIIYVGNSPSKDIAGAKNANAGRTVFIDYFENPADDTGPEADYSIKDLRELVPIVESLKSSCCSACSCSCK